MKSLLHPLSSWWNSTYPPIPVPGSRSYSGTNSEEPSTSHVQCSSRTNEVLGDPSHHLGWSISPSYPNPRTLPAPLGQLASWWISWRTFRSVDLQDQLDPFLPRTIVGQPLQPVLIPETCLQLRHCHLQCDQLPLKLYFVMHNSDSLYSKVAQTCSDTMLNFHNLGSRLES